MVQDLKFSTFKIARLPGDTAEGQKRSSTTERQTKKEPPYLTLQLLSFQTAPKSGG